MTGMTDYKLGSLFDGSGGFPLSGALCGIEPVWAAEVEPYPIAVTRSRFPKMKHLGDISKVSGADIEPVDIITFGSPCQDLSVAGKRAGLKHADNGDEETTRSGLFMEAVRIIKEMRKATNGKYPSFALWENVPGAFSSNAGQDFRIVLEELIKIVEPSAVMPDVPEKGWNYADSYVGDGWSLAYRVLDAQYWGVPQRRRRIYLVTDFRGERAREILFEREGVRGYFTQGGTPWQAAPADAQGSPGADDRTGEGFDGYNGDLTGDKSATLGVNCGLSSGRNGVIERGRGRGRLDDVVPYTLKIRSVCEGGGKGALIQEDKSATLATNNDQYLFQPVTDAVGVDAYNQTVTGDKAKTLNSAATDADHVPCTVYSVENHPADSRVNLDETGKVQTLTSRMGTGGGNVPMVMEPDKKVSIGLNGESRVSPTLIARMSSAVGTTQDGLILCEEAPTIKVPFCKAARARSADDATTWKPATVAYGLDRASFNQGQNAKFDFTVSAEQQPTLTARGPGAVCCTTGGFTQATEEVAPTLTARDWKDPTVVCSNYIVRRLTPTECARLQGFADWWGVVDTKDKLTEEEYRFWLEVRNTHARINGKKEQDYTAKQMLTWYNKLWTDSAEYKMWGNGIALPTALYCVQGVAEALKRAERVKWLRPEPCPVTPEQFEAIYNDDDDDDDDWMN